MYGAPVPGISVSKVNEKGTKSLPYGAKKELEDTQRKHVNKLINNIASSIRQ